MEFPKNIKLIVFDFDGTLFHLDINWAQLKKDLGIDTDTSRSFGQLIQDYASTGHPDLELITRAELDGVSDVPPSPAIITTLKELAKTYKLAILTRNSKLAVQKVLNGSGLEDSIYIVGREDVALLKPHPEGLHLITEQYQLQPAQTALVGDTFHDVEAAKAASATSIVVTNPRLDYAPKGADYYVDSIEDLVELTKN